jgi:undecaprenyl diphosphate synthase
MLQHLACIMDGNRRWARAHGLGAVGREGIDTAYRVVEWCIQKKIPYLSLFACSLENCKRSPWEMEPLFALMVDEMAKRRDELIRNRIQIRFVGDRAQFPASVRTACEQLEAATHTGNRITVQILFCYGSRQEIVQACRQVAEAAMRGEIKPEAITTDIFATHLWTAGVPDPDLLIRTGKVQRLSNFLLYQAAYAELYFPAILWPDLTDETLEEALAYFNSCKRNFGL